MADAGIGRSEFFEHEFDWETREILALLKELTEQVQRKQAQDQGVTPELILPLEEGMQLGEAVKRINNPYRVVVDLLALVDALEQELVRVTLSRMEQGS